MVASQKYKLSFTAAGLSEIESIKIAEIYLQCKDWEETKKIVVSKNLLQSRTTSRSIRVLRELVQRLSTLSDKQLSLLGEGNLHEQRYLLWFAVCKTYEFIREFAQEVLVEKYLRIDYELSELDYDAFFNRKADWNDELELITVSTKTKLKTVIFRMMREADLITEDNRILPAILSGRLVLVLKPSAPMSYQIYPLRATDLKG
jgi:hypothetical protein